MKTSNIPVSLSSKRPGRACPRAKLSKIAVMVLALLCAPLSRWVAAQGIPEPSLVMYGVIRNAQDRDRLRMVFGNLTWSFQPTGGGPGFTVSTTLTNINDQFSYVLRVPCETEVPGIPVSSNVLRLGSSFTRSDVFFNVTNRATLVNSAQGSFSLSSTARGQVERVDLEISVVLEDGDGNGLLDAWERLFFGRTGVDPSADADGDGLDNLAEHKAGTNPNDFQSQFRFVRVHPQAGGVLVEWSSVANRSYSVLRSSDVLTGYQVRAANRPATPPLNSFLDTTATPPGSFFYLLRLED
jgi:hypothetical protein